MASVLISSIIPALQQTWCTVDVDVSGRSLGCEERLEEVGLQREQRAVRARESQQQRGEEPFVQVAFLIRN